MSRILKPCLLLAVFQGLIVLCQDCNAPIPASVTYTTSDCGNIATSSNMHFELVFRSDMQRTDPITVFTTAPAAGATGTKRFEICSDNFVYDFIDRIEFQASGEDDPWLPSYISVEINSCEYELVTDEFQWISTVQKDRGEQCGRGQLPVVTERWFLSDYPCPSITTAPLPTTQPPEICYEITANYATSNGCRKAEAMGINMWLYLEQHDRKVGQKVFTNAPTKGQQAETHFRICTHDFVGEMLDGIVLETQSKNPNDPWLPGFFRVTINNCFFDIVPTEFVWFDIDPKYDYEVCDGNYDAGTEDRMYPITYTEACPYVPPTETPTEAPFVPTPTEDRGEPPTDEVFVPNGYSCVEHCDDGTAAEYCYCDDECFANFDCCPDYESKCGAVHVGDSCVNKCEQINPVPPSDCYCDGTCVQHGDCCEDFAAICAETCIPLEIENSNAIDVCQSILPGDPCNFQCNGGYVKRGANPSCERGAVWNELPTCDSAGGSCYARCGGIAGTTCYCDEECLDHGDCCTDYEIFCETEMSYQLYMRILRQSIQDWQDEYGFAEEFEKRLAAALAIQESRIQVTRVEHGSILVWTNILPMNRRSYFRDERNSKEAYMEFQSQIRDPNSPLRKDPIFKDVEEKSITCFTCGESISLDDPEGNPWYIYLIIVLVLILAISILIGVFYYWRQMKTNRRRLYHTTEPYVVDHLGNRVSSVSIAGPNPFEGMSPSGSRRPRGFVLGKKTPEPTHNRLRSFSSHQPSVSPSDNSTELAATFSASPSEKNDVMSVSSV